MANTQTDLSFFEKMKAQASAFAQKFNLTKSTIVDVIVYLGVGFLFGYLLKRFGLQVLIFIICLFVLQYLNIISVNIYWDKMQDMLGLQHTHITDGNIFNIFWDWVKLNLIVVLSFSIGFLIGIKVN
jgi:uncharacterized membrane protein (Fun14 family)